MPKNEERGAEATPRVHFITPKKGTQEAIVLEHLEKYGALTSLDAFQLYYITRLGAVVFNLRKKGYEIDMYREETASGKWFGRYELRRTA